MLAVLSFVRMLLEPAMDSRVFRPPSPWIMALLALLVEVYNLDNIKTGLKFEVGAGRGKAQAGWWLCEGSPASELSIKRCVTDDAHKLS
jgi:hypothetical protein